MCELLVSLTILFIFVIEGCLVPDDVMIQMVMDDAVEAIKIGQSLLLDGFPRTMEQAVALDKSLDVDMVINLCIPNETIIERISDRFVMWFVFFYVVKNSSQLTLLFYMTDGSIQHLGESITTPTNRQKLKVRMMRPGSNWCKEKMISQRVY